MKILVTGSNGLVGSSIKRLHKNYDHEFVFVDRSHGDLRDPLSVKLIFENYRVDAVIHTAGKVAGIGGNLKHPFSLAYDNFLINANIVKNCIDYKIKKLMAFSSICVFPHNIPLMEESKMHDGPIFESNEFYGFAKRGVDILIRAAEKQYGVKNYTSIIPGNFAGPNDLFSIDEGHIVPSLIAKMYLAKLNKTPLKVWGNGLSEREFFYVDDLSKALLELIDLDYPNRIIISGPQSISIRSFVQTLCEVADYNNVEYELDKPNGQLRRPTSKDVLMSLLPNLKFTPLKEWLQITWDWYCKNYPNVRQKY